jgi:hypothetical protein
VEDKTNRWQTNKANMQSLRRQILGTEEKSYLPKCNLLLFLQIKRRYNLLEFFTNHHSARIIEKACEALVADGIGICKKDSRRGEAIAERYVESAKVEELREENKDRRFGVAVYQHYIIRVDAGIFSPHEANVRFWYDKKSQSAGIKISEEDLIAIMQTVSVTNWLRKLDISLGGGKNGEMTLDKIAQLLTQTVAKIDPNIRAKFTAQRINRR